MARPQGTRGTVIERFYRNVSLSETSSYKESPCWIWTAYIGPGGYGEFNLKGKDAVGHRNKGAHSVAFELFKGSIPEGLEIDHLCRRTNCVNPAHLEAVTGKENILRGESPAARNARKDYCQRDHSFSPSNTYLARGGHRHCRKCAALRQAEYRHSKVGGIDAKWTGPSE